MPLKNQKTKSFSKRKQARKRCFHLSFFNGLRSFSNAVEKQKKVAEIGSETIADIDKLPPK